MKIFETILLILVMIELLGRVGYDGYGEHKYKKEILLIDGDELNSI